MLPEFTHMSSIGRGYVDGRLSNGAEFTAARFQGRWHIFWAEDGEPLEVDA